MRAEAICASGGFNRALRAGEDAELGRRLAAAGFAVLFEPALELKPLARQNVRMVLRRYARWNAPERPSLGEYLRLIYYSARVMAAEDLKERDLPAALVSLLCPHVMFWETKRD